jgi:hypothetical protein
MATLSGRWSLKAIGNEAGWQQRISILGSNKDGNYPMVVGSSVLDVLGEQFTVTAQAFNPELGQWVESFVKDEMSWQRDHGVVVTLYCDDNPLHADGDFNDLIVECTSLDEILQPPSSPLPRVDLTVPEQYHPIGRDRNRRG